MGGLSTDVAEVENFNPFTTRNRLDGSDLYSVESPTKDYNRENKLSMNDFLHPVTEIRQIRRLKFDPDSPRFAQACQRLQIDRRDIEKRRLQDFEGQIRNERPEDEQNPTLIRELAMIRYNYYLTTFKEVFNDVIEERRHIIKEEFMSGGSQVIMSSVAASTLEQAIVPPTASLLRSNKSQSTLKSRMQAAAMPRDRSGGPIKTTAVKKTLGGISTSSSVMALPSA